MMIKKLKVYRFLRKPIYISQIMGVIKEIADHKASKGECV